MTRSYQSLLGLVQPLGPLVAAVVLTGRTLLFAGCLVKHCRSEGLWWCLAEENSQVCDPLQTLKFPKESWDLLVSHQATPKAWRKGYQGLIGQAVQSLVQKLGCIIH